MKPLALIIACCIAMPLQTAMAAEDQNEAHPLVNAITNGKPLVNIRARHEGVDDSSVNPANGDTKRYSQARTVRTRVGYQTGEYQGFSAMVEAEDVHIIDNGDKYAPVRPGTFPDPNYAVVADPEVSQLNRANLQYKIGDLKMKWGRQRIILDNARFVGNVGWRQNEQTFDAFRADYTLAKQFQFTVAHISEVHGILPRFDAHHDTDLVNLSWTKAPGGKLTAYGYFLKDLNKPSLKIEYVRNNTRGGRYSGSFGNKKAKLLVTAEYAEQDAGHFDTDYALGEIGVKLPFATFKAGREVLGTDKSLASFQTPLATKHAFNGWQDNFLATPLDGLDDAWFMAATKIKGVVIKAFWHEYDSVRNHQHYGDETNLVMVKKFGKHFKLGAKAAHYDAEDFKSDSDKVWIWGELAI